MNKQYRQVLLIKIPYWLGIVLDAFWAVRKPIERRFVILITAFPVVFGMFIVALIGYLEGNTNNSWILAKTSILFIAMITSYTLAGKLQKEINNNTAEENYNLR